MPRISVNIRLESFHAETKHYFSEIFENLNDALDLCKQQYRFYLYCVVTFKEISYVVVDNIKSFKSNKVLPVII